MMMMLLLFGLLCFVMFRCGCGGLLTTTYAERVAAMVVEGGGCSLEVRHREVRWIGFGEEKKEKVLRVYIPVPGEPCPPDQFPSKLPNLCT